MLREKGNMSSETSSSNLGRVVSVRGSVVDVRFDQHLPPIYTVLRTGEEEKIAIEVLVQTDEHHVRGIALNPTQGLARGMTVRDTGGPLKVPVGKADYLANVRRFWKCHRPPTGADGCSVAHHPS
jgi:F-type H+-transporting ATPase subunit beta